MSDDLNERERLAAEFVLGTLDAADRHRAEALMRRDADFAGKVAAWNERLAPMMEAVPAEPVPSHVWRRIQTRLHARYGSSTRRILRADLRPARTLRLTERLGFWRWCTAGASAVAAALAAYIVLAPLPFLPQADARYVAVLNRGAAEPAATLAVSLEPAGGSPTGQPTGPVVFQGSLLPLN